jgi:acetyl esterase/lipase
MTRLPSDAVLDPEIARGLAAGPPFEPLSSLDQLPSWRGSLAPRVWTRTDGVESSDHAVVSFDGQEFAVRVHRPTGRAESRTAVIWMHGGGFVAGSHLTDDERFDRWCSKMGVVGFSVDYGLAPERPYPGPIEDCYAALRWAHCLSDQLGIDSGRIGVGGVSAGGSLAAALALLARDRGEFPVAFQALVYPMLDDRMVTPSSSWQAPIWPPVSNELGWNAYLGGRRGGPDVPIYAAPARAGDLAALPPAFVGVGSVDCFLDEDVEYAQHLAHSGVAVDLHVYAGGPHGFDSLYPSARVSQRLRSDLDSWLAARCEHE